MGFKKHMVYFLLAVFMMARVEPAFPYLKAVPKITHNILANITSLCTGSEKVNILDDVAIGDQDDDSNKEAEKEGEKEAGKSIKEECKMLLHSHSLELIAQASSNRTLFHLYRSGKERTHVNEVFRPPLV